MNPSAGSHGGSHPPPTKRSPWRLQAAAIQCLTLLHDGFDALALGFQLPGCYYPGCLQLGSRTENSLQTSRCQGCRVAR